jgi:hypothetical protein
VARRRPARAARARHRCHALTAHSEKDGAAGNYKGSFGFYPLLCFLDGSGEGLVGLLRPGNAGSNSAADHELVLIEALQQLPAEALDEEILVRSDIGGGDARLHRHVP